MFTGELLAHQISPCNKLCARKRMLLAFAQGTGKSVIAIASAEKLLELGYIKRILVLAPTGIAWQWEDRIKEFTDHEDVTLVESKNRPSREYSSYTSVYTVVPYSVFRRDYKALLLQKYDLLVADEAQEFSSFRSKTFKLIKKFQPQYRWALTGTAISNKLEELYAILEWVDRYFLPHWQEFEKRHIVRNPKTKQILKYKNLESLNRYLLSKRVVRCTMDEIAGTMPELIPQRIYIEKDINVSRTEHNLWTSLISSDSNYNRFDPGISKALHEARQALASESKLNKCLDILSTCISESERNRIIVYSFYKEPLYYLYDQLGDQAGLFTGDQSATEKQANVNLLKEGRIKVLLCSDAGKAGLDLPFANYTIHLDVPFSFGTNDQRSTRTQRVTSKFKSVVVIYLLVRDSIETFYYQVTVNKGKLAKATLEGAGSNVTMRTSSLKEFLESIGADRREDRAVEAAKAE